VRQAYGLILASETDGFLKKKTLEVEEEERNNDGRNEITERRERDKEFIEQELGPQLYQEINHYMVSHRRQDLEPVFDELLVMVGGNRSLLNHVFRLDEIIFHEMVLDRVGCSRSMNV